MNEEIKFLAINNIEFDTPLSSKEAFKRYKKEKKKISKEFWITFAEKFDLVEFGSPIGKIPDEGQRKQLTLHSSDHCNNLFLTRDGKEVELKDISNEQLSRLFKVLNSDVRYQNIDYKFAVYEELQKRGLKND